MAWASICNNSHGDGAGSLGALVRERAGSGRVFAVTAAHVLATNPQAALNDEVEIDCNLGDAPVLGQLCDWLPRFDSSAASDMDIAISTLGPDACRALSTVPDLLPAGLAQPALGADVFLRREGGQVRGTMLGYVSCWVRAGQNHPQRYFIHDAVCYHLDDASVHGNSGAPVWDQHERLVAIHIGATPPGTAGNALGVPIQRILDRWSLELVSRGFQPSAQPPLLPTVHRVVATGEAAPAASDAANGDDTNVLIRTVYGEARGEPEDGMAAVAHVVLNRVRAQRYWGRTITAVCLKPYQFSCWNANDPNRARLLELQAGDARLQQVAQVVQRVQGHAYPDPTDGATHYHNRWMARPPRWVQGRPPCRVIGNHAFYKNID
ncbi:cell wall hydrolase [Roseateles sp. DC23W]|uniref:Cell wall hydrolase n=1 Tax=Pelomonas dachongensis TaxID=3299029 RepID=A0ABW7EQ41_9BURK